MRYNAGTRTVRTTTVPTMTSRHPAREKSTLARIIDGDYGLALTYWTAFSIGAIVFFVAGSLAVIRDAWPQFVVLVILSVAWTFVLLFFIQRAYTGEDPGTALARIAMLFLLLNLSNTLATLSFIY